ncbi:hypothetical protein CHARACLAT_030549 [Characodon lateralis]|uniref:Uncharacterized protein n=1 Tax=Characodon lateralis TaxID=208331 RepID=A0ABU7D2M4_9TELE|nr:hypothetical protein [Characodon lateralis]
MNKMDLLNALQFLNLNQVPQDWVDAVWDLEFTERKPIEDIIEDKLRAGGEKSFRSLYYSLLDHAAEQQQSAGRDGASQGVWVILGENGVSLKSLVAVLSHFVLAVRAKGVSVQQRVCGLYAASVYLLLLGIPVGLSPAVYGRETGYTLDRSPMIAGQHRDIQNKQPCTHSFTPKGNLERPINPAAMFLDCGRKPEYLVRTHACTGRTCKLHAERPQARSRTQDLLAARQQCYQLLHQAI